MQAVGILRLLVWAETGIDKTLLEKEVLCFYTGLSSRSLQV